MAKWYSVKEAPDLYEWIVTEWYEGMKKNISTKQTLVLLLKTGMSM